MLNSNDFYSLYVLSFDNDRISFVFRQFFSAGFVATYDVLVMDGGSVIDFGARAAESAGGVRARMTIKFSGDDSYDQEIDLAAGHVGYGIVGNNFAGLLNAIGCYLVGPGKYQGDGQAQNQERDQQPRRPVRQ